VSHSYIFSLFILIFLVVMIFSACMFIMGYAMTWAPGVWILIGEFFQRVRGQNKDLWLQALTGN
jgi:hypothetical protein